MRFIIKGVRPIFYDTLDWTAVEEANTKICVLNIEGKLFKIDSESFEMLNFFYENNVLDPMWTVVIDNGHTFVWM